MNVRVPIAAQTVPPALIAASGARASLRFPEFNSFDLQVTGPISLPFRRKELGAF